MLELKNIEAGYGGARVYSDLTLKMEPGEVLAVGGPNGAGKSTLLKLIAGAVRPWNGKVTWQGEDVTTMSAPRRAESGIVLCPEGRKIFGSLSIEENLRIGATVRRKALGSRAEDWIRSKQQEVYDIFPVLGERRSRSGGALSGGQQQMLAIGRALMADPKLLLLDEPSLGLSPLIADEVYAVLADLRSKGLSMVIVEEAAGRPLAIADQGILMRQGEIARAAPADQLLAESDFAADYLGAGH